MAAMTDLDRISQLTLAHYDSHADSFFAGTIDHDVSQNIHALLAAIEGPAPWRILDLGCGPGRDLKTFTALGHIATGVDGSAEFVAMAKAYSGCEVLHQNFLHLDLAEAAYDGIFANASLFHVPKAALQDVLGRLYRALKPGGVLFSSNPRGHNEEGWNGERYGSYHDLDSWRRFAEGAGFQYLDHYFRPPGLPLEQQRWLASVWRKPVPAGKQIA
jgi:SAM-dependent methyltransferase